MVSGYSPLAVPASHLRQERHRNLPVWGVCVHQAGTPKYRAPWVWQTLLAFFLRRPANFAHYIIGRTGHIAQVADEAVRSWHAGIEKADLELYRSENWTRKVAAIVYQAWRLDFACRNPLNLFPGVDPNECYISVELIPAPDGSGFTVEQYRALAALIRDVWVRYGLPDASSWPGPPHDDHWPLMRRQGRLVGHEDLNPLRRSGRRGGWCPGFLGSLNPRFFWTRLFSLLQQP